MRCQVDDVGVPCVSNTTVVEHGREPHRLPFISSSGQYGISRCSQNKSERINVKFIISIAVGLLEIQRHHQIRKNISYHKMYVVP